MSESRIVEKTIASLKKRLELNNQILTLQLEEGYITEAQCTFFEPLSDEDILHFSREIGYSLPEDYIAFLKITNGCRLFDHPVYGGESYLFGIWDIFHHTYEDQNDAYLKIGYFYEENIYIDLELVKAGKRNYLFVKEHIDQFSEGRALNMNFEMWLDRFIICQGTKFWNFNRFSNENM